MPSGAGVGAWTAISAPEHSCHQTQHDLWGLKPNDGLGAVVGYWNICWTHWVGLLLPLEGLGVHMRKPWSQEVQTSKEHKVFSMQSHDYWAMKLVWINTIPWGVKDGRTRPSESETHPQGFVGCLLLTMASFVGCWQPSKFRRERLPYYLKALQSTSPDGSSLPSVKNDLLCVLSL